MLGKKVRDKISGYEGVVSARIEYVHGEPQVQVDCSRTDGGLSSVWFVESRVEETA